MRKCYIAKCKKSSDKKSLYTKIVGIGQFVEMVADKYKVIFNDKTMYLNSYPTIGNYYIKIIF